MRKGESALTGIVLCPERVGSYRKCRDVMLNAGCNESDPTAALQHTLLLHNTHIALSVSREQEKERER